MVTCDEDGGGGGEVVVAPQGYMAQVTVLVEEEV